MEDVVELCSGRVCGGGFRNTSFFYDTRNYLEKPAGILASYKYWVCPVIDCLPPLGVGAATSSGEVLVDRHCTRTLVRRGESEVDRGRAFCAGN